MENTEIQLGSIACASWIKRPNHAHLVAVGRLGVDDSCQSSLEIFTFDNKSMSLSNYPAVLVRVDGGGLIAVATHPTNDNIVFSTRLGGCKLYELCGWDAEIKLLQKESIILRDIGPQRCLVFSVDGSKLACGGLDGHLRIFEWPSLRVLLDEPKAHSVQDMDFSLDSEFLVSTSIDGSARIWKVCEGILLTTLTRNSDEKMQLCRFSRDGTKPFLFCVVLRGKKALTAVWDISTWNKIGHKNIMGKPASVLATSWDSKYIALGSQDGDVCVVDVKKMAICHWSKGLHLDECVESLEFCPTERVVLSTSSKYGAVVTKLKVPADWREWEIYMLLVGMFLASMVVFYIFFKSSNYFWNFPIQREALGVRGPSFHPSSLLIEDF